MQGQSAEKPAAGATDLSGKMVAATQSADMVDVRDGEGPFDRYVNMAAEIVGVAIIVAIATIVFVNATGRYFGGFALTWGDEVVISLMPWLGMCGMFLSIRRRQIIRIDYFAERMPRRLRVGAIFFANTLSAAVFVYLAVASLDYLRIFGGDRTVYLQWPTGIFTSALAIGSLGAAFAYGAEAARDLKRARSAPQASAP